MSMGDRTDWPLPPDLDFAIIDQILDDKPTLASCSLVCSRWLPLSRKHLFKDITVKRANHLSPDPLADFLHVVKHSRAVRPEWAIGTYVKKFKLDGRLTAREFNEGSPTMTCTLSVLRALLSALPHLASLCVAKFILDDTSQEPDMTPGHRPRFELDELSVSECSGPAEDPRHLFALICTFSSICSLSVDHWGRWRPNPLSTFSLAPFSPPLVRSLTIKLVREPLAARALYALFASSPSVTDGCLTRISVHDAEWEDLRMFVDFANLAGAALRDIELRLEPEINVDLLHTMALTTCTALSSLTLSIECTFDNWALAGDEQADDTRHALHEYTQILDAHRGAFAGLTAVRLEMRPVGLEMLNAFVRVAQDIRRVWPGEATQPVEPHEAEQSRQVWVSLEHVLCGFPALERVEFVLYETSRPGGTLTEAAKAELRSALERRLPSLSPSGIPQLVFETVVY